MTRLRKTGIGRSLRIAVRSNQRALACASVGLSPARVKLMAFAVSA